MAGGAGGPGELLRGRKGCKVWGGGLPAFFRLPTVPGVKGKLFCRTGAGYEKGQVKGVRGIAQM